MQKIYTLGIIEVEFNLIKTSNKSLARFGLTKFGKGFKPKYLMMKGNITTVEKIFKGNFLTLQLGCGGLEGRFSASRESRDQNWCLPFAFRVQIDFNLRSKVLPLPEVLNEVYLLQTRIDRIQSTFRKG